MKQHTEDYKLTAVRYYINNEDATYQRTCDIFECSLRSLKRWVQIYDETENLKRKEIHKRPNVRKIIANSGNEVVYTLPYSPRLNPIEQFFNQLKHYMKIERAMNLRELKESVKRAFIIKITLRMHMIRSN